MHCMSINNTAGINSLLSHLRHHTDVYRQTRTLDLITLSPLRVHNSHWHKTACQEGKSHTCTHCGTNLKQIFDGLNLAIEGGFVKTIPVRSRELAVDIEAVFDQNTDDLVVTGLGCQ